MQIPGPSRAPCLERSRAFRRRIRTGLGRLRTGTPGPEPGSESPAVPRRARALAHLDWADPPAACARRNAPPGRTRRKAPPAGRAGDRAHHHLGVALRPRCSRRARQRERRPLPRPAMSVLANGHGSRGHSPVSQGQARVSRPDGGRLVDKPAPKASGIWGPGIL